MSETAPDPVDEATVHRLMRRGDGFARGLGLDDATARRIAEEVTADMPFPGDEERVAEARKRMVVAAG